MEQRTIIYIGGFKLPDKNAAAQRVTGITRILMDLGYKVVFIDAADDLQENDILMTKKDVFGCDCYSVKYPQGIEWYNYLISIEGLKRVYEQYKNVKAVIAYNYQSIAFLKLKSYCKKNNLKLIADCTEWYDKTKNPIKNIDTWLRMKKLHPSIDGVIVISRYLESYYQDNVQTIYIPPTVDAAHLKWKAAQKTDKNGLSFVYAGSVGRGKDKLNLVIEALSETDIEVQYKFNVVGMTKEQYLNDYPEHKALIERLNDRVVFNGRLSHIEAINKVKNSTFSVFFRPNTLMTKAGFPTKYVEAVTCGTPVVTNKTSDLGDYIKDGENAILIDGYGKRDIKKAFERVFAMTHEQIAAIKAECGAERDKFDYRKYKERMSTFIDEVLNKK